MTIITIIIKNSEEHRRKGTRGRRQNERKIQKYKRG